MLTLTSLESLCSHFGDLIRTIKLSSVSLFVLIWLLGSEYSSLWMPLFGCLPVASTFNQYMLEVIEGSFVHYISHSREFLLLVIYVSHH